MTDENTPKPDETPMPTDATPVADETAAPPEPDVEVRVEAAPVAATEVPPPPAPPAEPEPEVEPAPVVADAQETTAAPVIPQPELEPEGASEPEPVAEAAEEQAPLPVESTAEAAPAKKPRKPRAPKASADPADAATQEEAVTAPASADPAVDPGATLAVVPAVDSKKKWYVVKVQSGREDSIKAAIERKIKIEGLEEFYGQIAIPVEQFTEVKKVTEKKNGERVTKEKKVLRERKKFQGYLFAEVEFNDRILYVFRETSGVGDFVGASLHRAPTPMTDREVQSMLTGVASKDPKKPTKQVVKLDFEKGDKVKIRDGAFANMEGEVKSITEAKDPGDTPKVKVEVTIFGRPVEVDLDYWHVDKA